MFLMIDNYDSFTYNIVQYIERSGHRVEVVRNDESLADIDPSRYAGIVLSPGPSLPENSGSTLEAIERFASVPMLGVCLGMQAIAHVFGGKVVRARRVMHGKCDRVTHRGGALFSGVPSTFTAVRYHSLAAEKRSLPEFLQVEATSSDGEIMAISHRERFLWGIQFHPESYRTEFGSEIINNFIGGAYEHRERHD